jgi:hypothetical protein
MPSKSKAQQRLMAAAEHGASFPAAKKLRQSMTHKQLHDFAVGPLRKKPEHVADARSLLAKSRGASGSAMHPHKNLGAYLHKKKA